MDSQVVSEFIKKREPIVISGMSGRFPESDTISEFAENLYNNVDMVVVDDRRWPTGMKLFLKLYLIWNKYWINVYKFELLDIYLSVSLDLSVN